MKHKTDKSFQRYQNSSKRVDFNALSKLTNIIKFSEFNDVCPYGFDVVHIAKRHILNRNYAAFKVYNTTLKNFMKSYQSINDNINSIAPKIVIGKDSHRMAMTLKKMDDEFGYLQEKTCVLYAMPYISLNWYDSPKDFPDIRNDVVMGSKRPLKIRRVAEEFRNLALGSSYSFLHWRYNLKDFAWFGNNCKGKTAGFCKYKNGFDAEEIGSKLGKWLTIHLVKKLYIATPHRQE